VQDYKNIQRWADTIGAPTGREALAHGQPLSGAPRCQPLRHEDAGIELLGLLSRLIA